jgi:hypothetical protein
VKEEERKVGRRERNNNNKTLESLPYLLSHLVSRARRQRDRHHSPKRREMRGQTQERMQKRREMKSNKNAILFATEKQ